MNITEEQLKAVEDMAYRLFPAHIIAINIGVDELELKNEIRTPDTDVRKAFFRGYIRQQNMLRESIIKSAKNGSNPAQMELIKLLKEFNRNLIYG